MDGTSVCTYLNWKGVCAYLLFYCTSVRLKEKQAYVFHKITKRLVDSYWEFTKNFNLVKSVILVTIKVHTVERVPAYAGLLICRVICRNPRSLNSWLGCSFKNANQNHSGISNHISCAFICQNVHKMWSNSCSIGKTSL